MFARPMVKLASAFLLAATLAACESAEDRAEEHFQSGVALLEQGDFDRAVVEFRNVFDLFPNHREARQTFARALMERGNTRQAYGQYLRLVEQYPDDVEGRRTLAEISFLGRNWSEFERHGERVIELAPDEPRVKAIALALAYREHAQEEDMTALDGTASRAEALLKELPDSELLRNILLDNAVRGGRFDTALVEIDLLIESSPEDRNLYNQRLAILGQLQDAEEIETQLSDMVERFPDDNQLKATLVRFYVSRGDMQKAEDFLRSISDPTAEDTGAFMDLVRFVRGTKGNDAARAELNVAVEQNPNPTPFRALLAVMDFEEGERDKAVAEMESILSDATESTDTTREVKVALARMLISTDNVVGARRLVEEVLAEDGLQVEALKMQARWQIDADDTDGAIANLRTALDASSEDTQAMTMMAEAYVRAGNANLARDFLSLAVDASNNGADETIRYARVLLSEERFLPAEDIIIQALRRAPGNASLLNILGQLYVQMEDTARAEQVLQSLRNLESPEAASAADGIEAAVLNLKGGAEEAMSFLEGLASGEEATVSAKLSAIRGRLASGDAEGALDMARKFAEEEPDAIALKFSVAAAESAAGNLEAAAQAYRDLLADNPRAPRLWLELARVTQRLGNSAAAETIIDEGLELVPQSGDLLWAKASFMERNSDVPGAIEIYERLYALNSNSIVVANNLASLLSTHYTDDESLERAYVIARRFRGTEIPAMQDTYGWIAHRRGDTEEALPYLENAAAGLPQDALVQYHLGVAYATLERNEDALGQFRKVIEVAGPLDGRRQIAEARSEIDRIEAVIEAGGSAEN